MAKTSECIGCASDDSYLMDKQSIINRNEGLGVQHNGNGTIQYTTNISVSLGKLWFRNTSKNTLCGETIDETLIPNKIKLVFDSELTKILEDITINPANEDGPEQSLTKLFEQIEAPNNLGEILPIIEIDADALKEEIVNKPISKIIVCKNSTYSIITLKPEVWEKEVDFNKNFFVHNVPSKKFKQTCRNGKIGPAEKNIGTAKKPKMIEIPYTKGDTGIQLGSGRIYTYYGTSDLDAATQSKPPQSERDCIIIQDPKDVRRSTIPWVLSIVPLNTDLSIEQLRKAKVENLLICNQKNINKTIAAFKKKRDRFIRFYNKNIVALCKLLKYSESLDEDNIIDCKVEFYRDDVLLQPKNRSNIKVSLNVGFFEEQDPSALNFNDALSIEIFIDDENIGVPQDPRPSFVRLKCPAFKNLGELSKIEDYITADVIKRNTDEQKAEIYIINDTIYSRDYPYCDKETKDIPRGDLLLALDRSDSKVNDIWKSFLSEVETGIMCSVSSDPLLKDFEDTLTNNIKLSNYKSSFGTVGEKMTFYSHKLYQIEERPTNNEIVIRNKNLGPEDENAYIDCISGLFIDKLELDTSLFENTFFKDYKVNTDDNTHKFKTYECPETKKKLVAAQDLFLKARIGYPVYILRKLPNEETQYIKQIVYLNIDLPFKSKLTGDSILYHNKDFRCDSRSIFIKATVNGVESIKTLQEHFGASLTDADDFFFNLKFENNKPTYIIDNKYNELLPQILKINQDKLEQKYGKNFEYEPFPSLERGSFNITESVYVYNKEKNTTLPCKDKINEAIRNLEAKRNRAISRYHEPLFDFLSTIHVLDQNGTVTEGFINESQNLSIYAANQAFYRKALGESPIFTFLQITPTGKTIGGRDSLIKRTYSTSDGEEYNRNIKTYNTSDNKPSFSLNINAPKAPEIHPSLEKMLAETSDDNLLLPGKYQSEISKLKSILDDPEKYRETCGRGILGEGEK